ncbi:MAG: N-6 DNA methylase [Ignavibacteriae bacterium]|nr:N-6 DNA methylase [Ignavibacteriota bacterium]
MDKAQLNKIFSKPFNISEWMEILQSIFGARLLLSQPKPILLPSNEKANAAYELGSFTTSDDRIIGLYKIDVNPDVWLERNKVGLRELLRNVYRYDVDGAIVVFDQNDKWRLSFISEIKVLNDEGEVVKQATEPKRYTYLLGENEKVKTPADRLSKLAGKALSLKDILNAFSVEALNEEFYKIVADHFYQLIGGKTTKGKKEIDFGLGILELPGVTKDNRQVYQEFAVRLIGRTVFCWFLKMKKPEDGEALLPEKLLSSDAVKKNKNYYHSVLERIFFQTLNTPMEERVKDLPDGCENIPFLNGGLFEPGQDDYYRANKVTGLSEFINTLKIDDSWFLDFFQDLEKYNFTIDENSVTDVEVSVDPEMLGRIFENLLAEIDPDSGETARKATGSFYTPREIVDYMSTESLVQYLHNKTGIEPDQLRHVFKMREEKAPDFSDDELERILDALDKVKILDPACGSGAFPMGILQKIVQALQKLDPESEWWKQRQVARVSNPVIKKQLREKLEASGVEYARKIGVIQNSLYGVDIQPVAAEISKLRCFLSLIVDENIDDAEANRGILPLPNLEFKFVTADTLLKLPPEGGQQGLFDNYEELQQLEQLRNDYLQSTGKAKDKIKERFTRVQNNIFKSQVHLFSDQESRAYKLSVWNPFGHEKADWFDPKWMYGVEDFNIVIANPPYVLLQNTKLTIEQQQALRKNYVSAQYKTDLYHLFFEAGISFCEENGGVLCYITPNTFLKNKHNDKLRELITKNLHVKEVVRFYVPIFLNASVDNSILIGNKVSEISTTEQIAIKDIYDKSFYELNETPKLRIVQQSIMKDQYSFNFDLIGDPILSKLQNFPVLSEFGRAYFGIQTFDRTKFVSKTKIDKDYLPVVDGINVNKYLLKDSTEFVCFRPDAIKSGGNPLVYEKQRILVRQIGAFPEGCLCPPFIYTLNTIYNIFLHENSKLKLTYLLALINSSTIKYYWIKSFSDSKKTFPKIKKAPLESIPIVNVGIEKQKILAGFVYYVLWLNDRSYRNMNPINQHVPNSHIAQQFEELIDAMVMELFFEEDFKNAGIEFIKYAERDFKSIEHLASDEEKIEVIHIAYQKLREKDNEIRNNLKLMDIKLADIVMPIKTVM